ncbi:hypothetical protein FQR65_LT09011 [Abscondita terminalis]|nr:hypothetical protein FQR65_LT09011 [Abscondita terminalis]
MEGDSSNCVLNVTGNDLRASKQNGLEIKAVTKRKRRSNRVNQPFGKEMYVTKRTRSKRAKTNDVVDSEKCSDSSNQYNHDKGNDYSNDVTKEWCVNNTQNNISETLNLRVCLEDISLNSSLAEKYNLTVNSNSFLNETCESTEDQNRKSNENKSTKKKESPKKMSNKLETLQVTVPTTTNINQQNLEKKTEPNNSYEKSPTVLSSPAKSDNSYLSSSRSTSNLNISTSSKDSSYTRVLINNYPVPKPFNITINVGSDNQERKVEFSTASTRIEPTLSPDNNDFWQNEKSHCDESIPVLQFYSGDWFFDITDDDSYNIVTTDSIFNDAVLPSANSFEIHYSNTSPVSTRSLDTFNDGDSRNATPSFQFTKPILPPAKRPPTRRKNTFGSPSSCFSSTDSSSTTDKLSSTAPSAADDDAISLYSAWSIKSTDFCTKSTVSKSEDVSDKSESKESNYLTANSISSPIKKSPTPITTTVDNPVNFLDTQKQHVMQWLENTQTKLYGDFHTIPVVFRPLCYFYYTYDYCKMNPCRRKHNMNRFIHQNLLNLSNDLLMDAYKFARSRRRLFYPLVSTFITSFLKTGYVIELVKMATYVAFIENTNKVSQIRQILMGLQSTGRSFVKSIEEIIITQGENNIVLSDVLLEIVCDQKADLNSNWYLIRMLCQYRKGYPINATIVDDIMLSCIDQENVEFCMKVVKDIFVSDFVDLIAINDLILSRFISFLQNKNLTEQANVLLTKAKLNNVNIISSFHATNNVWLDSQTFKNRTQEPQTFGNNFPENISSTFASWTFPNFDLPKENPLVTNSKQQQVDTFQNANEEFIQNNWSRDEFESPNRESVEKYNSNDVTVDNTEAYSTSESIVKQVSSDSEESSSSKESISNSTLDNPMTNSNPSSPSATNKSLEYTDKCLSDYEIKKLCDIIANNRSEDLLSCYNKFKNSSFNNSFVMNVISLLKHKNKSIIYQIINDLIENLEQQNSHFGYLDNAESSLYLLAVNAIALLKRQKGYQEAAKLLFKFKNSLENLLKVQWFRSIQKHSLSNAGKYLYFCQIFMRGEHLEEALGILTSSDLKLLNEISMWNLQKNDGFDNDFRNDVVDEFVKISLRENLKVAKNIIIHMITFKDNITELSLWKYFDDLVLALLNSNGLHFNDLVQMLPNILQGWYKNLKKQNIRGLLVKFVSSKVPEKQLIALYNKCIKRHMYDKLKGTENSIVLKTDMTLEEIFITIRYYLYKLEHKNHEAQEVTINIKMPEQLSDQPQILITSDCRMQETRNRILLVLTRCFPTAIIAQITNESQILIKPTQIKLCVERYRKLNDASNCIWVRQSAVEKLGICEPSPLTDSFTYMSK